MKLHVICVAYERPLHLDLLIDCFLLQTNPEWELHIIHDGKPSKGIMDIIRTKTDKRVHLTYSQKRNNKWGHPNRKTMLRDIVTMPNDFILITNDDNYYVPRFVGQFMEVVNDSIGMVYCNAIHSYTDYGIHNTRIKEGWIDIGSFMVRSDVAKDTGFNHEHISADGAYAEDCLKTCQSRGLIAKGIDKYLFIHN